MSCGSYLPIHTLVLKRSRDLIVRIDKVSRLAFCKMTVAVRSETRQQQAEFPTGDANSTSFFQLCYKPQLETEQKRLGEGKKKIASWAVSSSAACSS